MWEYIYRYAGVIILFIVMIMLVKWSIRRIIIFEHERGIKYVKGRLTEALEPGSYWYFTFSTYIQKLDIRPCFVSITGQEVLSSDGVTLKVSIAAKYKITDPTIALNSIANYQEALYLELQVALREIISGAAIDDLLKSRDEISKKLMEMTEQKIQALGLNLLSVSIKDIMFPGQLKQIFAHVVKARKEGQAALEKARAETAALRSLANAARMLESNPHLMQLRIIQAINESSGNTLVLGVPSQTTLPLKTKIAEKGKPGQEEEDTQEES